VPNRLGTIFVSLYQKLDAAESGSIVCGGENWKIFRTLEFQVFDGSAPKVGSGGQAIYFQYGSRFPSELEFKKALLKTDLELIAADRARFSVPLCSPESAFLVQEFTIETW